ncbi:MAG: hypothetical protein ABFD79_14145 [Phycisphaerales bacterium]
MRYFSVLIIVFAILFSSGCQQSQKSSQAKSAGVERKERLMAAENISLQSELENTKKELDKQKALLEKLQQDYNKLKSKSAQDVNNLNSAITNYSNCFKELNDVKKQLEECQKMVDLTDVPALCKDKIERQKQLLANCEKEKEEISKSTEEASNFLMNQLPQDLMKQVETLTAENEQLKAKIEELEKTSAPK